MFWLARPAAVGVQAAASSYAGRCFLFGNRQRSAVPGCAAPLVGKPSGHETSTLACRLPRPRSGMPNARIVCVKRALISDIHANLEALLAVHEDIKSQGLQRIYCLGDIIGYGPNPVECLDLVIANCAVTILGNHDQAALFDPDGFNPMAMQAAYWSRAQLEKSKGSPEVVNRRWDFLGELPRTHDEGDYLFVHGSPREPTNEYVFPEDVYNERKMEALFSRIQRYCFQGHTHLPGIFTESGDFLTPEECGHQFTLGGEKTMINVGSVGQPRDGDPRACYAVLDDENDVVIFRRVGYDYESTADKIYNIPELSNTLGDRLRTGR
jgi:diadenosine tetraphosphatase ApaH/serine/threonine PP2A family protein phosphatase